MRIAALVFSCFLVLASCERATKTDATPAPAPAAEPAPTVELDVADELPGLSSPATGIAFWEHPSLSFNSLMIVANAEGLVAYNMEDGNEVSSIPGVNAQGAAVSYIGVGQSAVGILATFDTQANGFKLYMIDPASRAATLLLDGPAIRGNVRGYCFGRGAEVKVPTLFVVQRGKVSIINFNSDGEAISVANEATVKTPDDLVSCAVDLDGALLLASKTGDIYKLASADSFSAPFASASLNDAGDLTVVAATVTEDETSSVMGQIILLDKETGALHVFDRNDGHALGVVHVTESFDVEAITSAAVMGATGANLGGLYRDGVIAFGVGVDAPAIRLIPVNGVMNALSLPEGAAISPRGAEPEPENDGLTIETGFQPG